MVVGDIVRVAIGDVRIDGGGINSGFGPHVEYISENTFAISFFTFVPAAPNFIRSYDISNIGAITYIDAQAMRWGATASYGVSQIFAITGEVYGIIHHQVIAPAGNGYIDLAQIPDDGIGLAYLNGPASHIIFGNVLASQAMGQWVLPLANPVHFASFFTHGANSGWIQTFRINGLVITNIANGQFEAAPPSCFDVHACHVSGNIYAIVYRTLAGNGILRTVSISDDGLTITPVATITFEATGNCQAPHIVLRDGNIYAIAHRGPGATGWITTVSISTDGLTLGLVNTLDTTVATVQNWFLRIGISNMFILFSSGVVTTIDISADGVTLAVHDTNAWGGGGGGTDWRRAARLPDTAIYAMIETRGVGNEGWLTSFEIDSIYPPICETNPATEVA